MMQASWPLFGIARRCGLTPERRTESSARKTRVSTWLNTSDDPNDPQQDSVV
jgi:hypothetical protein